MFWVCYLPTFWHNVIKYPVFFAGFPKVDCRRNIKSCLITALIVDCSVVAIRNDLLIYKLWTLNSRNWVSFGCVMFSSIKSFYKLSTTQELLNKVYLNETKTILRLKIEDTNLFVWRSGFIPLKTMVEDTV